MPQHDPFVGKPLTVLSGIRSSISRCYRAARAETLLAANRIARGNLQEGQATEKEVQSLNKIPGLEENPLAIDFLCWRRSTLWGAMILGGLAVAIEILSFQTAAAALRGVNPGDSTVDASVEIEQLISSIGHRNFWVFDAMQAAFILASLCTVVFMAVAARRWTDARQSRKWARIAWLTAFGVPILLGVLPGTYLMDFSHLEPLEAAGMEQTIRLLFAVNVLAIGFPKVLSLFPGIVRSAVIVKTLIPESGMPGWIVVIVAPLYSFFLLIAVGVVSQIQADLAFLLSMACFLGAQVAYLIRSDQLVRVQSRDTISAIVKSIRLPVNVLNAFGVVLGVVFFSRLEGFTFVDAIQIVLSVVGNLLLMSVVSSDLIVAMVNRAHRELADLGQSEHAVTLGEKCEALSRAGLTSDRVRSSEK